jgi:pyroglutamyl-peptidase
MRTNARLTWCLLALAAGCGGQLEAEVGRPSRDGRRGGLFHDFLDGKYDGDGHPLGAQVFEAESACSAEVGGVEAEGWGVHPEAGPGKLCRLTTRSLAAGRYTLNVRALGAQLASCQPESDQALLELRVRDNQGRDLGGRTVRWGALREAMTYQNLTLGFSATSAGPVSIEVESTAAAHVRLDYLEVFTAERRLVIAPPSGVLAANAKLAIEVTNPPAGASLELRCGSRDQTAALGAATREEGELALHVDGPAAKLLEGCSLPARFRVQLKSDDWVRETSRTTYLDKEPPCSFKAGTKRVLLTGFEPFPADSTSDNSSEQAVLGFDEKAVAGISVMKLVLPVEWDTAAAMIARAVDRCRPDLVLSFGQGRSQVDLESTAYNEKDSSELAGGTPDNRGVVMEGQPIAAGGPAQLESRLPLEAIRGALAAAGVDVTTSDDPGRYICNNVFYATAHKLRSSAVRSGFVHLPRIASVGAAEKQLLRTVVKTAIEKTLSSPADL